jgi:3-oxoacyl-[acyl-carrier-protein] synthase-3
MSPRSGYWKSLGSPNGATRKRAKPSPGPACLAAKDCLDKAGVAAADLGMILVASGSSDRFCPGPASQIAAGLGLATTPALDIPVASAGSLIGLILAARLAPNLGRVLVIGAEIMSRRITLSPENKNTAILFGDGAGAALIDAETGFARIADSSLFTDGNSSEILSVQDGAFFMDGQAVIMHASRKMPRAILELLGPQRDSGFRSRSIPAAPGQL